MSNLRSRTWPRWLVGALIAGVALATFVLPTARWVETALDWVDGLGIWGGVVFVAIYVAATVLFVPGSLLTVGAGFVFGIGWGTVVVSAGSTLGAVAAFVVGRYLAGDWVAAKVRERPKLQATIRAVENDALKVVFLLRLVPLFPFNILNYALGLTDISWRKFLLASWVGMLPGTIAYVSVGAAAGSLTRALSGEAPPDTLQLVMWGVGAVAAVVVVGFVARRARAELESETGATS